jgi:hypothetical protein
VNFTREPLIETIITPKDGYKLLVRNSKTAPQEEYMVEAIEVVSFGHSFFFRCLERPKCFLVPVTDYEVVEVKETRVALKNATVERSIKIGGGREAPSKPPREPSAETAPAEEGSAASAPPEKKRERRSRRRRRGGEERQARSPEAEAHREALVEPAETPFEGAEASVAPVFSTLFPPPPTLVSSTISRYKDQAPSEGVPGRVQENEPPLPLPTDDNS